MATTFPLSTYALSDRTRINYDNTVARDLLHDGTINVRVLGDSSYATVNCVFEYLSGSTADSLLSYVQTNRVTEFDLVITYASPVVKVTGYIMTDPVVTVSNGQLYTITFDLRGSLS